MDLVLLCAQADNVTRRSCEDDRPWSTCVVLTARHLGQQPPCLMAKGCTQGQVPVAYLQTLIDGACRLPQMVHVTAAEHDWLAVVRRAAGAALMHQLSTHLTALAALQPRQGKAQMLSLTGNSGGPCLALSQGCRCIPCPNSKLRQSQSLAPLNA